MWRVIAIFLIITCFVDQTPFKVADNSRVGQEIPRPLDNWKMFITVLTKAHHWALSRTIPIKSIYSHTSPSDSIHRLNCANIYRSFSSQVYSLISGAVQHFSCSLYYPSPHTSFARQRRSEHAQRSDASLRQTAWSSQREHRQSWVKPQHKAGEAALNAAIQ
jgi:hypothetical protein